jgi:hypothetical protein
MRIDTPTIIGTATGTIATASFAQSASLADATKTWYTSVYSNASYSLPGGYTLDTCRYNVVSTEINTTGWFNTTTYRFTPQKAGYWLIIVGYDVYRGTTVEAGLNIFKNTTGMANTGGIGVVSSNLSAMVYLNGTTDYITGVNTGGGANTRTQDSFKSILQARWIGNN